MLSIRSFNRAKWQPAFACLWHYADLDIHSIPTCWRFNWSAWSSRIMPERHRYSKPWRFINSRFKHIDSHKDRMLLSCRWYRRFRVGNWCVWVYYHLFVRLLRRVHYQFSNAGSRLKCIWFYACCHSGPYTLLHGNNWGTIYRHKSLRCMPDILFQLCLQL